MAQITTLTLNTGLRAMARLSDKVQSTALNLFPLRHLQTRLILDAGLPALQPHLGHVVRPEIQA